MSQTPKPEGAIPRPPVETLVFQSEPQAEYTAALAELLSFLKDMVGSRAARKILFLAALLAVVLILNMIGQIQLNQWQGGFYRAIEKRNLLLIRESLMHFAGLVVVLLSLVVSQTFLHERLKIGIREWLTRHLLENWLVHGRAYRLNISSDQAVNPDQRIQEDCRNFSELSADLGIGLTQATLLLISFIGVLWAMSGNISFEWQGTIIRIPGYMVWVALVYAGLGSLVTARVGRPLIMLNEQRYQQEASFRFSIVRVNESAESVAFFSGEEDEKAIISSHLESVLSTMRTISNSLARLTWITSGYGWIMIVLPVLVALPGYLQGSLDLGGLMMVVGAFGQVQQSLRWFVDNFPKIADWRAAMHRVTVFRNAVDEVDLHEEGAEQIQILPHPDGNLAFENLKISLVDGDVVIADATAEIKPGERVLITGESGSGKSTLFRAAAGLWPWGSGIIRLPPVDTIMFLPQRPYMPLGTLAEAIAYPKTCDGGDRERMLAVLERVNLNEFADQLERVDRWDRLMSLGQQQRFAFARLLFHKPKWVFLDEATSALDDENQGRVMALFQEDLAGTSVVSIGHRPGLETFHTRTLQLESTRQGTVLRRRRRPPTRMSIWRRLLLGRD